MAPTNTTSPSPAPMTSLQLQRELHGKSRQFRAQVAFQFVTGGRRPPERLSPAQAARLCRVDPWYVGAERRRVARRVPRDVTIDRVVKLYGVDALLRGCDRATAPAGNGSNGHAAPNANVVL